jgi:hypothetical protein
VKSRLVSEKGMVQLITYLILNVLLTCICLDVKSFKNTENNRGDRFSPCLTLIFDGRKSEQLEPSLTQDFAFLYIFCIIINILDTVIFAETAAELQSALNAMYLYCETWKLKVNTAKTNVVIFSKSRQSENIDFIYNNERLTVVDEFQYLGTIFSRKGNFGRSKARLVQQARKAMFYVLRKARKLSLPIDILLQLFDVMVAPILLYGAEVWGYEKNDISETLHIIYKTTFVQYIFYTI